jgi:hypothetical protein
MINEFKAYHGSAFAELIDDSTVPVTLFRPDLSNNAVYVLNGSIGLYLKHSVKRISPWRFTFHEEHVEEVKNLLTNFDFVFLVLICGRDSIAVIDSDEIGILLPLPKPEPSWISVQTGHNTMLTVEGSAGNLKRKIRKSRPFNNVKEILESMIEL